MQILPTRRGGFREFSGWKFRELLRTQVVADLSGGVGGACGLALVSAWLPPTCAGENTAIRRPLAVLVGGTSAHRGSFTHAPPTPPGG